MGAKACTSAPMIKRAAAARSVRFRPKRSATIAAGERPEQGAEGYPAGDDLERDVTDVERFLDPDESARNDPLVVAEKGARQHNDRNDAGGAGERKVVGDKHLKLHLADRRRELSPAPRHFFSAHARAPPDRTLSPLEPILPENRLAF